MLFAIMSVALMGQSPVTREMDVQRAHVLTRLEEVTQSVAEFDSHVRTRFAADNRQPKTGLIIASARELGEDGFHAVTVIAVVRQSSGFEAGAHPGDRIVRVNARVVEHEPEAIVYRLMDDHPGPVTLVLRRGSRNREVILHPRPLACLIEAAEGLDTSVWLTRLASMSTLLETIKDQMDPGEFLKLDPDERPATLSAAKASVVAVAMLLPRLMETVSQELDRATMNRCKTVVE